MAILHLVRPRLSIQGFLAVLAVLAGLVMIFLARIDIPNIITLIQWKPESLFLTNPSLLVDDISWYFTLALVSLAFTVVITSIAQLGLSQKSDQLSAQTTITKLENLKADPSTGTDLGSNNQAAVASAAPSAVNGSVQMPNWVFWVAVLVLTSVGLLAVTGGNLLTLIMVWAALDIIELTILLGLLPHSENRERAIIVFTARLAGIITVLIAGMLLWSKGGSLQINSIPPSISVLLVLAAGIRLGVFPPQHLYTRGLPLRSDLSTLLRLISAATCFILLVRVANSGGSAAIAPYLLSFFVLVGLYAAFKWLGAKDELDGSPYWMLASASLAIAAAIIHSPLACLVWSLASLLSGGLIFSFSLRHRNLLPLFVIGVFNLSLLPFSPTWQGMDLFTSISTATENLPLMLLFSVSFLLIQSLLLAGFINHLQKGMLLIKEGETAHIERWVWVLYPLGLLVILVTHLLIGWFLLPELNGLPFIAWIIGPLTMLIAALILFITWRFPQSLLVTKKFARSRVSNDIFSFDWLYNFIWKFYRTISRLFALVSSILEGDGGILWALVLFALIFVLLQR